MKILMTLVFVALPAVAQACGGEGGDRGCGGIAPFLICSVIAGLGYWVLQHSGKDGPVYVKRTGGIVGFALIATGLLGLMCAMGSHVKKSMSCRSMCDDRGMMQQGQGMQAGYGGQGGQGGQGGGGNGGDSQAMPEAKPAVPAKK